MSSSSQQFSEKCQEKTAPSKILQRHCWSCRIAVLLPLLLFLQGQKKFLIIRRITATWFKPIKYLWGYGKRLFCVILIRIKMRRWILLLSYGFVTWAVKFCVCCAFYLLFSQLNNWLSDCETLINNKEIIKRNSPETSSSSRIFLWRWVLMNEGERYWEYCIPLHCYNAGDCGSLVK